MSRTLGGHFAFGLGSRAAILLASSLLVAAGGGCRPGALAPGGGLAAGEPADFAFAGIDGQVVSDERASGRVTVLLFATTFDLDSQAQAKHLEDLYRTHAPRINAVLVFLEAPQYVELARSFRDILKLSYPVALADQEDLRSSDRFPPVHAVPTWIVLDRNSRPKVRHEGSVSSETLLVLVEKAE